MRFPHKAYAEMIASEEDTKTRRVAPQSAGEKKILSESAIDDDEVEDVDEPADSEDDEVLGD